MKEAFAKAKTLMEALPYIKEYSGKTVVVKYGGGAMLNQELKKSVASDLVLMKYVGINLVIVHGGGQEITKYMNRLQMEVKFVQGQRVTNAEALNIVKMVLVGKINKEIVAQINRHGRLAVGVSGDDGCLIQARKRKSELVDLGFVGDVEKINIDIISHLIKDGFIPVIASVGLGKDGESYNINADQVAGKVASEIKAEKIIFLTDVEGLYQNLADKKSLISALSLSKCQEMVEKGEISEGMLPKVEGCIVALKGGVNRAHILNGTIPHALLLEIFTDKGIGTMVMKD